MIPASLGQTAPDHLYIELTTAATCAVNTVTFRPARLARRRSIRRWCTGPFRNSPLWPDEA